MDEEQQDICAICLDPYLHVDTTKHGRGSLLLACGHEYHAGCLLLSCRKHPVHEWKCPLCRDQIVRKGMMDCHGNSAGGGMYTSHWECLQSFLNNATESLQSEFLDKSSAVHKNSIQYVWVNTLVNKVFELVPVSFDKACVTICGKYRVQYILDPTKEPYSALLCRHIFSILTSLVVFCSCTWFIKWFCTISVEWICPTGRYILIKMLPNVKGISLERVACFIKLSMLANYIHAASYALIITMLFSQANRSFRQHLLHDWPSVGLQVNAGLLIIAIFYSLMLFTIRLILFVKLTYGEIMSIS